MQKQLRQRLECLVGRKWWCGERAATWPHLLLHTARTSRSMLVHAVAVTASRPKGGVFACAEL